jgi:hypothetical protein
MHQKIITGFISDCTIMPARLVQDVGESIYRTFRDRCSDLNIDLGKAVTDALDMWLEHSDYDEAFIERQRKILREEEFVRFDSSFKDEMVNEGGSYIKNGKNNR